jgi:hypothetical protein
MMKNDHTKYENIFFKGLWVPAKDDSKTNPEDGFVLKDQDEVT